MLWEDEKTGDDRLRKLCKADRSGTLPPLGILADYFKDVSSGNERSHIGGLPDIKQMTDYHGMP